MTTLMFQSLAISLLLGGLVGLQRQHVDAPLGGVRTFPLISVFGSLCAILAEPFGGWMIAAGLLAVVTLIVVGHQHPSPKLEGERSLSTEMAMLLMFAVGALCVHGPLIVAVSVGAGVAVLLQLKPQLHGLIARLGDVDVKAIMQFVLITFIVLPVLPNETYGPLDVLNPRDMWLMVVLVVGISLGGYISYKFFGQMAGLVLSGLLGGLISSTATTASYSRRTAHLPEVASSAATIIVLATSVSFVRVLLEIAIVSRGLFLTAAAPLLIQLVLSLAVAACLWRRSRRESESMPLQGNPTELKSALWFGLLYGGVLLGVAAGKEYLPESGLYGVAILSGLTDMDAITLSTSRLVEVGRLNQDIAWRVILTASLANLVFKTGLVACLGHRRLLTQMLWLCCLTLASGVALVVFWK